MIIPMPVLLQLWDLYGDVSINGQDKITDPFLGFPAGTDRFEIQHWFEECNPDFKISEIHEAQPVEDLDLVVLVIGDIAEGFEMIGPVPGFEEANDWATMYCPSFMDWHAMNLINPSKWLEANNIKEE